MKNILKNIWVCILIFIACLVMCIEDVRCDGDQNKDPTKESIIAYEELQVSHDGKEQLLPDKELKDADTALKTLVEDGAINSAVENNIKETADKTGAK